MNVFNKLCLTGMAGLFAVAVAAPARADSLAIWQCASCIGGIGGATGSSALNGAGTAPNTGAGNNFSTAAGTGTWTPTTPGVYNFNLPAGGTDSVGGFLATGSGAASGFTAGQLSAFLSFFSGIPPTVPGTQTEFLFGFSESGATNISITHDDGIALFVNGVLQTPSNGQTAGQAALPTNSLLTTYSNVPAGAITLAYVASNGLPEVLNMAVTAVPLPAAGWLFGAGLGGIALLMRRRRNAAVAMQA
jgi:hypothetical protein